MADIGSAYLSIYPSMNGFASRISAELGRVNVSGIGTRIGSELGDGVSGGLDRASKSTDGFSGKLAALAGVAGGVAAEIAGTLLNAIGSLAGEMVEAADSSQKFASTLSFARIDDSTIKQLTASTQEYADKTVYDLTDIRNATAQLAANGVANYAQLAEAAGNLNAVAGGNAETFKSVSMVMTQTAGSGKLMTENWNQLTDAIPGASGALQQAMRDAGAFEGNFRDAMEAGEISSDEFFAAVQKLGMKDVAVEAAASTSTIEGALGNLQASVVGVGSQAIQKLTPAITGAMNVMTDAISALPSLLSQIGDAAAPALQPLASAMQGARESIQPVAEALGGTLLNAVKQIGQFLAPLIPVFVQIGTTIVNIGSTVLSVLLPILNDVIGFVTGTLLPVVQPAVQAIFETVSSVMGLIQARISQALGVIKAIWDVVWPPLSTVVSVVFGVISGIVSTVMGVIQGIIQVVTGIISGDWSKVWQGIQQVFGTIWNAIKGVVTGVLNGIKGFISGALNTIKGVWNSIWGWVSSFVGNIWGKVKTTVSNGVNGVVNFVKQIPNKVKSVFSNFGSLLVNSGKSLIDGLVRGIKGAIEGAVDTVKGFVGKIRDLFPFSPAKDGPFSGHGYTTYSGKALITDFGKSIVANGSAAVNAASKVLGEVDSVFTSQNPAFAQSFGFSAPSGTAESETYSLLLTIITILTDIYGVIPEGMDEQTFGRKVRKAVSYDL